jgi:putative aldouronate transport system permease protein
MKRGIESALNKEGFHSLKPSTSGVKRNSSRSGFSGSIMKNVDLYIMFFPVLLYFIIFHYVPIYGLQLAFKNFIPAMGIGGSPWVGLQNFERFFNLYNFWPLLANTLGLSAYNLAVSFPLPILVALLINELGGKHFKKFVQTVTYAPHFISVVVMVGMLYTFLSPSTGIVNILAHSLGSEPIDYMANPALFKTIYVLSEVWQHTGWASIIYLAALAGIDPLLHESAVIDGANKVQRIWYINLPGLAPTIIIMLILNVGRIMDLGFEKVLLMQNPLNLETADVISTYVYKIGILNAQYSFATAIDLFNNIINFILLVTVNKLAKRYSEMSLW